MNQEIELLLNVQEKHAALLKAKAELAQIPETMKMFDKQIADAKKIFETKKSDFDNLCAKREQMRQNRRELEARRNKYKIRLSEVKKNDEYQTLQSEIERIGKQASDIEDEEIQLLMDIDSAEKELQSDAEKLKAEAEKIEVRKSELKEEEKDLEKLVQDRQSNFEKAGENVDKNYLATYLKKFAMRKKLPILVPIKDGICGGCFLKVSGEILENVSHNPSAPVECEQCGRLLYL